MQNIQIYLASQSPRRRLLLRKMGISYQFFKPNISERIKTKNPRLLAVKLAQQKVVSVEQKIKQGIIIGVDTVVVINNRILGKPKNKEDARIMLNLLSGRKHRVISGIYILQKPQYHSIKTSETTKVKFRILKKQEIDKYLDSKEPYDKAGAYGIQGKAGFFVDEINGCYFNVVGLPITKLLKCLKIIKYNR